MREKIVETEVLLMLFCPKVSEVRRFNLFWAGEEGMV